MTLPKTYTTLEVAKALGMTDRWVRDQINLHGALHMRAGRKIRFTEEQFQALCDKLTQGDVA